MKKAFALCVLLAMSATQALAATERFTLDPSHTTVAFLITHVGYAKTLGQFSDVSGEFNYDAETMEVSDVRIVVKTASVSTANEARDKHVRKDDFLGVEKHPEMVFTATSGSIDSDGKGVIEGELNLLGQSQSLALSVVLNKAEKYPFGHKKMVLGVSARGEIQRSDFGMDYGVGNGLVGDTVELIIETEAMQTK